MSDWRPESPDLSGLGRPVSPDLSSLQAQPLSPRFNNNNFNNQHDAFAPNNYSGYQPQPTSIPQPYAYQPPPHYQQIPSTMAPQRVKTEAGGDDEYMPDAHESKRPRRVKKELQQDLNFPFYGQPGSYAPAAPVKEELADPTLGCQLRTSFPVARIKRIMQADEDIGKVAQVTPTVVSRALELFMIKLISAAAHQARGPGGDAGASKGPKRVLAQHLKKAVVADEKLDFLVEIVNKVPDAPTAKAKKENGSDSEENVKPKRKGKKRKDSGDDF